MNRRTALALAALALAAAAALLVWRAGPWGRTAPGGPGNAGSNHPAAARLVELLQLRRAGSADASAYAEFFAPGAVPEELARDASATAGTPPIPAWRDVYASRVESLAVSVVVVWRADSMFEEWPPATIFEMELREGAWLIVDARALTDGDAVPPPANGGAP